ncbi:Acetyl-hydrolase [Fusarium oxysporum f. sp. albedinis]|nr:Acetyl-hydrolase [Fusarium oxysporum f. sp. albedinis]
MVPAAEREGRWVIRSMLWVSREVEAEQVSIESLDVTAAVIRLPDRLVFTASVYVPGGDAQALQDTCGKLGRAITEVRRRSGRTVDVVITGDFNRHDQMWGGDDISVARQGEADPIRLVIDSTSTVHVSTAWKWMVRASISIHSMEGDRYVHIPLCT